MNAEWELTQDTTQWMLQQQQQHAEQHMNLRHINNIDRITYVSIRTYMSVCAIHVCACISLIN